MKKATAAVGTTVPRSGVPSLVIPRAAAGPEREQRVHAPRPLPPILDTATAHEKKEVEGDTPKPASHRCVEISEEKATFDSADSPKNSGVEHATPRTIQHVSVNVGIERGRQPSAVVEDAVKQPRKSAVVRDADTAKTEQGVQAKSVTKEFSADIWEVQRERELQQLRLAQQAAEERRMAAVLEEEHRRMGDLWVASRKATARTNSPDPHYKLNMAVYFAAKPEDALSSVEEALQSAPSTAPFPPYTLNIALRRMRDLPLTERNAKLQAIEKLCQKFRNFAPLLEIIAKHRSERRSADPSDRTSKIRI